MLKINKRLWKIENASENISCKEYKNTISVLWIYNVNRTNKISNIS